MVARWRIGWQPSKYRSLGLVEQQRRPLPFAVRGQQTRRRWSKLKEWLAA
jgi:hypothetical protein